MVVLEDLGLLIANKMVFKLMSECAGEKSVNRGN